MIDLEIKVVAWDFSLVAQAISTKIYLYTRQHDFQKIKSSLELWEQTSRST